MRSNTRERTRKLVGIALFSIRFLMDNIGNQLSTKKVSDTMVSNGRNINVRTVEGFIVSFLESYIVYQAKRYDIKGKQYLKTLEK